MPRAFEVKSAVAAAAEKQLWSAVRPLSAYYYGNAVEAASTADRFSVTFAGSVAFASKREATDKDGNRLMTATINYPFIDDNAMLTRAEADLFAGYTLHEIGHLLHTDFDLLKWNIPGGSFLFGIWNGLEDPRIEASMIEDGVGGARPSFVQLANKLMASAGGKFDPCDTRNIPFTLAVFGRAIMWGYEHPALRNFVARLPEGTVRDFYVAAAEGLKALPLGIGGAQATIDLARKLHEMLKAAVGQQPKQQPKPEPEQLSAPGDEPESSDNYADPGDDLDDEFGDEFDSPAPQERGDEGGEGPTDQYGDDLDDLDFEGEGEGGEGGDGGEGEGEGDGDGGDGEGDEAADSEGALDDEAEGSGSGSADTNYEGGFGSAETDDFKSPELDVGETVKRINKRNRKAGETLRRGLTLPGSATVKKPEDHKVVRNEDGSLTGGSGWNSLTLPRPASRSAALRGAILNMLASPDLVGWDNGYASGRLDRRSFGKVLAGCENVFERRWESEGIDTAVTLLLDISGSMSGTRINKAHEMANTLSEIFDKARVDHCVLGFESGGGERMLDRACKERTMDGAAGRTMMRGVTIDSHVSIVEFKPFGKSLAACRNDMDKIFLSAGGNTPLHSGVAYAGSTLVARPEKRRLLLVLTDGLVSDREAENTKARVEAMQKAGIDVIGIGIDVNLSYIFDVFMRVETEGDLSAASFNEVRKVLERRNRNRRTM